MPRNSAPTTAIMEISMVRMMEAPCLTAAVSLIQSSRGKRRFIVSPTSAVNQVTAAGSVRAARQDRPPAPMAAQVSAVQRTAGGSPSRMWSRSLAARTAAGSTGRD